MWDLSPLTRDQTSITFIYRKVKSYLLDCQGSPKDLKNKRIGSIDLRHGG